MMLRHVGRYSSVAQIAVGFFVSSCGTPPMVEVRRVILHEDINSGDGASALDALPYENPYRIHSTGWETTPVVLRFEDSTPMPVRNGVENAAHSWNEAVGFELLKFEGPVSNFKGPLFDRLKDDISTVGLERHWCRTGKSNWVLATTIWDNSKANERKIVAGDLVFNSQFYIFDDAQTGKSDEDRGLVDAETLALHELGHLLGLAHSPANDGESVMQPDLFIGPGQTSRVLFDLDVARIRYIYVPGSEPPPVASRSPSSVPSPSAPTVPYTPSGSSSYPAPPPCDWDSD